MYVIESYRGPWTRIRYLGFFGVRVLGLWPSAQGDVLSPMADVSRYAGEDWWLFRC